MDPGSKPIGWNADITVVYSRFMIEQRNNNDTPRKEPSKRSTKYQALATMQGVQSDIYHGSARIRASDN